MVRRAMVVCLLVVAGCAPSHRIVLGRAPAGAAKTVSSIESTPASEAVTVEGVLIEKCPVAGCWFNLRDTTGTIKVDTKAAGFVVVDVPLNTRVLVSGRIVANGSERMIEAAGLRY